MEIFFHLATKKRAGEFNKGIFDNFLKEIHDILRKNKFKSSQIYTMCSIRSPELGRIPKKKSTSRHLLLINAEDPCQYTYLKKKNPDCKL
jgi:hypothetical protein